MARGDLGQAGMREYTHLSCPRIPSYIGADMLRTASSAGPWPELPILVPELPTGEGSAQWLPPELRVRVKHLKTKGLLRHATVKQFITDNPIRRA
jgi:hypothetical protein